MVVFGATCTTTQETEMDIVMRARALWFAVACLVFIAIAIPLQAQELEDVSGAKALQDMSRVTGFTFSQDTLPGTLQQVAAGYRAVMPLHKVGSPWAVMTGPSHLVVIIRGAQVSDRGAENYLVNKVIADGGGDAFFYCRWVWGVKFKPQMKNSVFKSCTVTYRHQDIHFALVSFGVSYHETEKRYSIVSIDAPQNSSVDNESRLEEIIQGLVFAPIPTG